MDKGAEATPAPWKKIITDVSISVVVVCVTAALIYLIVYAVRCKNCSASDNSKCAPTMMSKSARHKQALATGSDSDNLSDLDLQVGSTTTDNDIGSIIMAMVPTEGRMTVPIQVLSNSPAASDALMQQTCMDDSLSNSGFLVDTGSSLMVDLTEQSVGSGTDAFDRYELNEEGTSEKGECKTSYADTKLQSVVPKTRSVQFCNTQSPSKSQKHDVTVYIKATSNQEELGSETAVLGLAPQRQLRNSNTTCKTSFAQDAISLNKTFVMINACHNSVASILGPFRKSSKSSGVDSWMVLMDKEKWTHEDRSDWTELRVVDDVNTSSPTIHFTVAAHGDTNMQWTLDTGCVTTIPWHKWDGLPNQIELQTTNKEHPVSLHIPDDCAGSLCDLTLGRSSVFAGVRKATHQRPMGIIGWDVMKSCEWVFELGQGHCKKGKCAGRVWMRKRNGNGNGSNERCTPLAPISDYGSMLTGASVSASALTQAVVNNVLARYAAPSPASPASPKGRTSYPQKMR